MTSFDWCVPFLMPAQCGVGKNWLQWWQIMLLQLYFCCIVPSIRCFGSRLHSFGFRGSLPSSKYLPNQTRGTNTNQIRCFFDSDPTFVCCACGAAYFSRTCLPRPPLPLRAAQCFKHRNSGECHQGIPAEHPIGQDFLHILYLTPMTDVAVKKQA